MSDQDRDPAVTEVGAPDDEAAVESAISDPYKRRVAVILALFAVLGGWIGILHSDAATNESITARETTRTAVASMRATVNRATVDGVERDLDAEAEVALTSGADLSDDLDEDGVIDAAGRAELDRELLLESERLSLRRAALAETRVTYNNRASQYETVLTTLGVALFLVGITLVLDRRMRPPILVPGIALALYVAGWALWIHHRGVPETPEAAIEATAEGSTDLTLGDPQAAIADFDRAIDLDDDVVDAYTGRSLATYTLANPDFSRTLAVVSPDGDDATRAIADADRAVDLSDDGDFRSLLALGAYRFFAGDLDGAIEDVDEAVAASPRAPEAYLLLAAAHLADGDDAAADDALDQALALLDTEGASDQNRQLAAEAFTLLEYVAHRWPDRAEAVEARRLGLAGREAELVFGSTPSGTVPSGTEVRVERLELDGDEVRLDLAVAGVPDGTDVSVYLYEQPADGAAFVQAAALARFITVDGDTRAKGSAVIERSCRPVALRLDVYVDGGLAESFSRPGGAPTC